MTAPDRVLALNADGLSNRAIAEQLSMPRSAVEKALAEAGKQSPRRYPVKRRDPQAVAGRQYAPGEVFTEWGRFLHEYGETIRLRAVAIRQYRWHLHCAVQIMRDGIWRTLYMESFPLAATPVPEPVEPEAPCVGSQKETACTCLMCGAAFLGGNSAARYCEACREERGRKSQRDYKARRGGDG